MPEGRSQPRIPFSRIFDAVFLGCACQLPGLHAIESECRQGALLQRIGPLSEDALRYALERQDATALLDLGCRLVRRLKRNGVLSSDWSRGRVVAALDGIEIASSYCRCCSRCLQRTVERKIHGQTVACAQYYHRIVALTVVSSSFALPLGLRFQSPGEGEVACGLTLVEELVQRLGRRFLDVLVADALYLERPFVEAIEALGLDWVMNLKDNQPLLLAEAQRLTARAEDWHQVRGDEQLWLWHEPAVEWPVAQRRVGVVQTVRRQSRRRVTIVRPGGRRQPIKRTEQEESTNFYASNIELGAIPPVFIHQIGRSRWSIETGLFQTITTDAHLKQASVHQSHPQALVMLTMIRLLAFLLTQVFYHRQVRPRWGPRAPSFCALARQLAYWVLVRGSIPANPSQLVAR
ncbi:MAG: transposase, partial [Terriglobia bacterium]